MLSQRNVWAGIVWVWEPCSPSVGRERERERRSWVLPAGWADSAKMAAILLSLSTHWSHPVLTSLWSWTSLNSSRTYSLSEWPPGLACDYCLTVIISTSNRKSIFGLYSLHDPNSSPFPTSWHCSLAYLSSLSTSGFKSHRRTGQDGPNIRPDRTSLSSDKVDFSQHWQFVI